MFTLEAVVLFPLGKVVATPAVLAEVPLSELEKALHRHSTGSWGELEEEDKQANWAAIRCEERILSKYVSESGVAYYIITEADRSVTTLLRCDEY